MAEEEKKPYNTPNSESDRQEKKIVKGSDGRKYEKVVPGKSKPGSSTGRKPTRPRIKRPRIQRPSGTPELMRLNKYISNTGVCSRREADEHIKSGEITVNGKVVNELGTKVSSRDDIRFKGRKLSIERKVYLLLNKPKDTITTAEDPHAKRTVLDLVRNACDERVFPVGRLDRNTTGVLLLTNDGDLTKNLTHPRFNKKKVYHTHLNKAITKGDLIKIKEGLTLEDGFIQVDDVQLVKNDDKKQVGVELHSGRNRIVRRIFEHLGYKVMKLDRVYFAGLTKKGLPRGKYRFLTPREVSMLKMNAFE